MFPFHCVMASYSAVQNQIIFILFNIRLFAKHVGEGVKIKAAGGISSMDDAEKFLALGADRLGTSRIVKIVKKEEGAGY